MANFILDASVVIEYLVDGARTTDVTHFFNQLTNGDRLTVPEFCLLECTNVIWKQVRFQEMPRADAENLLRVLRTIKLRRAPMKHLLDRSLDIALNNNLAIYDSSYIALSLHYGYPLVTIDVSQGRVATSEGVLLHPIVNT